MNKEEIISILSEVKDPEIPVLSISELGILRSVDVQKDKISILITPTYSGCPAMDVIRQDIRLELAKHGINQVEINQSLSPAWTTEWITADGKRKLLEFGIAPPGAGRAKSAVATIDVSRLRASRHDRSTQDTIACPRCGSAETQLLSQFGSTACKAHYRCLACLEPFDYFKPH